MVDIRNLLELQPIKKDKKKFEFENLNIEIKPHTSILEAWIPLNVSSFIDIKEWKFLQEVQKACNLTW